MENNFYRVFEDKHRGSRDLVKSRLQVYLPFVEKLQSLTPELKALDLGCGRGEWLELLSEKRIPTLGVDIDTGMLEACTNLNLSFIQKDIFEFLQSASDESYHIISSFHVVEHLPFPLLQQLVEEAHRILKPGGLLILETPNPENLFMGAACFYVDPTHQRPLYPPLLAFLPQYYGYSRTKILRLQEPPELRNPEQHVSLIDVLAHASSDYAVIAQKGNVFQYTDILKDEFDKEYGITLHQLAERYDRQYDKLFQRISRLEQEAMKLECVYKSSSWELTGPFRVTVKLLRKLKKSILG